VRHLVNSPLFRKIRKLLSFTKLLQTPFNNSPLGLLSTRSRNAQAAWVFALPIFMVQMALVHFGTTHQQLCISIYCMWVIADLQADQTIEYIGATITISFLYLYNIISPIAYLMSLNICENKIVYIMRKLFWSVYRNWG